LTPLCIGQLIESLSMGGAENLAVRMANQLAEEGHNSHLIILTEEGALSERVAPGVSVHYLGFRRASVKNPYAFGSSIKTGFSLLREVVEKQNIQVVQSHLPGSNFMGLLLELRNVCPVLATIHNNEEFRYGDDDNPFLVFARKFAYSLLLRKGHGIVAVSDDVRASLIKQLRCGPELASRVSVVTNAVPLPAELSLEEKKQVRHLLGISEGIPFILAAGRLSEQKNFSDLVEASSLIKEKGIEFQLVIGGEGDLRSELEQQITDLDLSDRIQLPGVLSNLNQVMQVADVFVMSSLWEGLPLVLLEAMAAGLPTVAFGIPGIDEVVADKVHGLKVPTGDTHQLAAALADVISDDSRRLEMGTAARDLIQTQYNFQTLIHQLVDLYRVALVK